MMLSKSKYVRGMNCPKSLWLYVHKKGEQVISEATQAIFSRGTNVGELAQQYFPNGKLAMLENYPGFESAKRTQEFIKQGVETIYEATFIYQNTLVAVDILHKENDKWSIYEVKSTNSTKPQHITDVAVQYYVVKGTGLTVEGANVMHFNKHYVKRGNIDVKGLFIYDSIFDKVVSLQNEIEGNIPKLFQLLEADEPIVEMGKQCNSPYACDFQDYCKSFLSITTPKELSSTPQVKTNEIRRFVDSLVYPICHLDFETIMSGVPMFNESRPYQQIPFQFSIHLQQAQNSEVTHFEYLAPSNPGIDPRLGLIEQMIENTKGVNTILVYYIPFERARIKEMMEDFPQYKDELQSIVDRLVDLFFPFSKKHYVTETMQGSASIKKVLPALCPELSYNYLEIGEGMAASNAFLDLYSCDDEQHKILTRQHLLKYCGLDTFAMVKLLEVLSEV